MIRQLVCLSLLIPSHLLAQLTPFEKSSGKESATYKEAITYYYELSKKDQYVSVFELGATDIGKPLHLVVLSKSPVIELNNLAENKKAVLLINNGIHPGEPCGIDASMMLVRDLLKDDAKLLPENVIVCIVPVYNIGGSLNRGSFSRANQIGPEAYGFRGNARNLDLNRDFIKCDSRNSRALIEIIQKIKPNIFIDTHTTDGADYQATMTLIPTQKDKISNILASYMETNLNPYLYDKMNSGKYHMCPYVNTIKEVPEDGISGFLETGRYSSGYTALFNTISYISEAHMLKPFEDRVNATYELLMHLINKMSADGELLLKLKQNADLETINSKSFAINWELNESENRKVSFKGFESEQVTSKVTGHPRTRYNTEKPFEKEISLFNNYTVSATVQLPHAYIIPQVWHEVIDRLQWNNVKMTTLEKDVALNVTAYYIDEFKSLEWAYEGHHINYETKKRATEQSIEFYAGDKIVFTDQISNRFLCNVLEPDAPDSYFNWNFFDEIIMQKEYFSGFVFDDTALQLLESDPALKTEFEQKQKSDEEFRKNHRAQLDWIYKRSPYYEKTHKRYPVYRIESADNLKL